MASIARFLETLYTIEPSKLVSLLSYIVSDIPKYYYTIYPRHPASLRAVLDWDGRKREIMKEISWFLRELETISITWNGERFQFTIGTPELDTGIRNQIESTLSDLGEEYLAIYHGSIEALMSDNPDNLRQSISSMRELLTKILHKLTEDDEFTEDEKVDGRPTRRARMKHILSKKKGLGTEGELADAIANTLIKTYDALSKELRAVAEWNDILYVFKSTEYLIYYILLKK